MKDRKISIRISEEQYRYLSDKGSVSSVLSDIIDRDMSDMSDKCMDKTGGSTGSKNTFNIGQACLPVEKLAARSGTNSVSKTDEPSSILGSGAKKNSGIRTSTGLWIETK